MFQHTIFFLPLYVPSTLTPVESKAVSLRVISRYESPGSVSASSGGLFHYRFLAWGCYFGQCLYSFYHGVVMIWDIWFHSDRPWRLWYFLGCSSSSSSSSESSESKKFGDFGTFWGCLCVFFYRGPLCHRLLLHAAYRKIISSFILHLSGPIIVCRQPCRILFDLLPPSWHNTAIVSSILSCHLFKLLPRKKVISAPRSLWDCLCTCLWACLGTSFSFCLCACLIASFV